MSVRRISKRRVSKRRIGAPQRVYENIGGEVFPKAGEGHTWKMPIKFLEKSGTPIYLSLGGDDSAKKVWQRSNRGDFHKRLLAMLAWKEARLGLGYADAVVWIGKTRFQPTMDDIKGLCSRDEIDEVSSSVRATGTRTSRQEDEGDSPMAKKTKKVKKSKKVSKASTGNRTPEERAKSNAASYCASLIATTTLTNDQISKRIQKKFPDCISGYSEGNEIVNTRRSIGKGLERFSWVMKLPGAKMANVRSHLSDKPSPKAKKTGSKKAKKVLKKAVAKKGVVRKIAKKIGHKIIKKVKRS